MATSKKTAASKAHSPLEPVLSCIPKRLAASLQVAAAERACEINPQNNPALRRMAHFIKGFKPTKEHIALVTSKYWGPAGVDLSVSFLDSRPAALRARIIKHMNAWALAPRPGEVGANVRFRETQGTGEVRIAFDGGADGGYWSYVGTDIQSIALDQPTMNLERFSMQTRESEFVRVVRHEAGHTLGFPHEHMRRELVARIDRAKAIAYFGRTQGWTPADVDAQVLTPLEESSIMGTERADDRSIMCYDLPPEITLDGTRITGGDDIDEDDFAFAARIYPPVVPPQAPVPPEAPAEEAPCNCGCGAASVQITSGPTRITVNVGGLSALSAARAGVTRSAATGSVALPAPQRAPAAAGTARGAVESCLRANAKTPAPFDDSTFVKNIVNDPDDVASCLNADYLRNSPGQFDVGDIQGNWRVIRLIHETENKH